MSLAPTHQQLLQLVTTGDLCLGRDADGARFNLRDKQATMTGRLIIRPDWNEGPDDRPGLMPLIEKLEDRVTGYCEEGYKPSVEGLPGIYEVLRSRLSPSRLFSREGGRWMLTSFE